MARKKKFSYLMLGLGIGIILTNFIHSINPKVEYVQLSDEDIIERATDLGMVFIKDVIDVDKPEEDGMLLEDEKKDEQEVSTQSDEVDDEMEEFEEVVFKINEGQSLITISKNLLDAGLIDDVDGFIEFVKEREMDKRFRVGTYKLNNGMDYETLLDILTKRNL